MSFKKITLFASAVAAFIACAVPAAQASEFYAEGIPLGETPTTAIKFTGNLSFSKSGFTAGPCNTHLTATIHNGSGTGTGVVHSVKITGPCKTTFSGLGCNVKEMTNPTEEGAEWPMMADQGEGDEVEIENVSVTNKFEGCGFIGLTEATAEGTLTATYNNETECFEVESELEGGVVVSGELCNTGEEEMTGLELK